jgi:chemotaxis family two-component system response regulator Rcp1
MGGSGSNPNPDEDRPSVSPFPSEERTGERRQILIVEDNPADVFFVRQAIEAANIQADLHAVKDGEQAIKFFDEADRHDAAPCPSLVILDINLPKKQGGEVLRHMRQSRRCAHALVIAVSTSGAQRDREEMTKLGANRYFRKPSEYAEFMKLGDLIKELLTGGSRTA